MRNVSKGIGAKPLRKRYLTKKEVREIGAKRHLANYPDIALITERLARRAKAEPKLRSADLFGGITHEQTLRVAKSLERCAPGVDGETFQRIERSEGGSLPQPQEPAAVSAEVRGHLLRGTQPLRHVLAQVGECPQGGVIDRGKKSL